MSMPPYYEGEARHRGRSVSRHGDRSPDYYYSGGAPPVYASGAMPAPSSARLQYEPQSPFYPVPNSSNPNLAPGGGLQAPTAIHNRPRSMPPSNRDRDALIRRRRRADSRTSSKSPRHDRDTPHSPIDKARHLFKDNFSNTNSGLGVGVLGAIVGGLAAREASEATARTRSNKSGHGHYRYDENRGARLISTIVGAAVGGFGANALEKRLEAARLRTAEKQAEWEAKWGRSRGRDRYRDGNGDHDGKNKSRSRGRARSRSTRRHTDGYDTDYGYYDDERPRSQRGDDRRH